MSQNGKYSSQWVQFVQQINCQFGEEDKKISSVLEMTVWDNKAQPKEWNQLMIPALNPSFLARNLVTSRYSRTEGFPKKKKKAHKWTDDFYTQQ